MTSTDLLILGLWEAMSSFEQQVFLKCTSASNGTITSAGSEGAFEIIRFSLDGDAEPMRHDSNMLLDLINHGQSALATKLITRMTSNQASATAWANFISGSLELGVDDECQLDSRLETYVLHAAARHGACNALIDFLDGRRVLVRNNRGDTPIHLAAESGNWKDLQILLEYVTTLPTNDDGWTPLHAAAASMRPDPTVVRLLAEHAKQTDARLLNARSRQFQNTALHLAARNAAASVELIAGLGELDPTLRNCRRSTPLQLAAGRRDDSLIVGKMLDSFLPLMLADEFDNVDDRYVDESDGSASSRHSPETFSSSNLCIVDVVGFECDKVNETAERECRVDCCGTRKKKSSGAVMKSPPVSAPTDGRASIDDLAVCAGPRRHLRSVLRLCAVNGHVDAVARLVRSGVDAGDVLHDLVEESVRRRGKSSRVKKLVAAYKTIVDNIVPEDDRRHRRVESAGDEAIGGLRPAVQRLIGATRHGKNVLERAIEIGAEEMLMTIVKTPNVFRFDDVGTLKKDCWTVHCEIYNYDVTNMIRSTMLPVERDDERCRDRQRPELSRVEESQRAVKLRPDRCYLEMIVENEDVWRHTEILKRNPFKKLSKSYIGFLRRMYLLIGLVHLGFMVAFSSCYLPSRCSLNERFRLGLDDCSPITGNSSSTSPSWMWLAWPVPLATYLTYAIVSHLFGASRSMLRRLISHERFADFRNIGGEAERFVPRVFSEIVVDKSPFLAFVAAFFFWFARFDHFRSHVTYLEALSAVFLSGWLVNFMIFNRVTRELYVFSLVLKAVVVEHIGKHFMPIFLFTVVGFSFAFHSLDLVKLHRDVVAGGGGGTVGRTSSTLGSVVYDTLVCVFGFGYLYDTTISSGFDDDDDDDDVTALGGHPGYAKAMFALFVVFTSLILLNYLIALLNGRYERERARAENAWRFDSLADFVRFERDWSTSWTFGWIHAFDYWFVCLAWPRRQIVQRSSPSDEVGDVVHVVQVQKYRPWPDDDEDR